MRIIAGEFRGRRLLPPKGPATRPITDRVKTSLFSILGGSVAGAAVLDLFCGTGSLGLEALSRGAATCCFADREASALSRLRRNIRAMGLDDRCRVWRGDVMRRLPAWLAALEAPTDLAFVDPPYRLTETWRWSEAAERLFAPLAAGLAAGGQVVFRCRGDLDVPDPLDALRVRDRREYGRMALVFLERGADG